MDSGVALALPGRDEPPRLPIKEVEMTLRSAQPVPDTIAHDICAALRCSYQGKWYTLTGIKCWGCRSLTRGLLHRMCAGQMTGCQDCSLVRTRYSQLMAMSVLE